MGILRSAHPELTSAALETIAAWECSPAHRGRVPEESRKQATLTFYTTDEDGKVLSNDWLEHAGIFLRDAPNTKAIDYFEQPVRAVVMVDPVYPRDLLQAGTTGAARVDFSVDRRGRVRDVVVAEATAPEFGASAAAAIAAWAFEPLRRNGEVCTAGFSFTWKFAGPRVDSPESRLLAALARGEKFPGPRQLDRPLQPIFTRPAVFPAGRLDAGEAGRAEIEAIVDQTGRVRLVHVRGASAPEFGWSAATAVSQWLFEIPLRAAQPTDVRMVLPVEFKAPPVPAAEPIERPGT